MRTIQQSNLETTKINTEEAQPIDEIELENRNSMLEMKLKNAVQFVNSMFKYGIDG